MNSDIASLQKSCAVEVVGPKGAKKMRNRNKKRKTLLKMRLNAENSEIIGVVFSAKSLLTLREADIDFHDSINLLIENPPSTVKEITHPEQYVKEKILKK